MRNGQFIDVTEAYDEMLGAFRRLRKNSDLAIMCVDGRFILVNTKDNRFNVVKELKKMGECHL